MSVHQQPKDYYQIKWEVGDIPVIETFFSTDLQEMESPEVYGMSWEQVQKTLHKHYKDLSNIYTDIANDWLTKTVDDHFLAPKPYQSQLKLW